MYLGMTKLKGPFVPKNNISQAWKNGFMPPQPKTDLAKLRSQISRRADDSYPVFARPVWHAGHADREAIWVWHARHAGHKIGMPSMTDFDVRSGTIS